MGKTHSQCGQPSTRPITAHNAGYFVTHARAAFLGGDPPRRREIVQALATGYRFFGPERRIEIELDPLLAELVTYARDLAVPPSGEAVRQEACGASLPVEPPGNGSQTQETAPARAAVSSGRPEWTQVDVAAVPERLIRLCLSKCFSRI